MTKANKSTAGVQTVTTYRDFESTEHLNMFVDDLVQHALTKFLDRHNTRIDVTLDNSEKRTRRKLFNVGVTLRPAHKKPIHVTRESDHIHDAIRAAIGAVEKILRRDHARLTNRRRHWRSRFDKQDLIGI